MIETIYSNENGEANRTSKVQASFKMPKNVRQVGKSNTTKKIYVEDYVMTFIKQLAGGDFSALKIAVLVGQCIKLDNCRNIFISGAVEVENIDIANEIVFSNDAWTVIYEEIKKYFVDAEIVGWFIGGPGYLLEDTDKILKAHVDNFAGQDKTLLTYDNMEKEEAFLNYENNCLCKQEGYYIYYEKNDEMQTYMIDHKTGQSNEVNYDDRVSRELRTVIQSKKPLQEDSKSITRLMYAAGTLLAVIILVVGAAMLSNYDQMKKMQETLNFLSRNMEEVQSIYLEDNSSTTADEVLSADTQGNSSKTTGGEEGSLNVEVVSGEVEPLEEVDNQSSNEDDEDNKDNDALSEEELAAKTDDEDASEPIETVAEQEEVAKVIQEEVKYYTVESGDTLAGISYKLYKTYTKVNKIMQLNGIEDQDIILVGQRLIVP